MAEEISKSFVHVRRNRTGKNSRTRKKRYIFDDSSRYVNAEARFSKAFLFLFLTSLSRCLDIKYITNKRVAENWVRFVISFLYL